MNSQLHDGQHLPSATPDLLFYTGRAGVRGDVRLVRLVGYFGLPQASTVLQTHNKSKQAAASHELLATGNAKARCPFKVKIHNYTQAFPSGGVETSGQVTRLARRCPGHQARQGRQKQAPADAYL